MKRILVQNTEDCKSISVENAVNSAREDIMKEGFTVKQVADKLNVSYDTVNNTVKKLNLKVEVLRLSGSDKPTRVLTKEQAKQIADHISRGRRQQTDVAKARSDYNEHYVASNETLTQIVSMLAEGQKETRQLIYQMQENQTKNFEILERILVAKESDYIEKATKKPLSEMWIPSAAVFHNYKSKLTEMGFSTPKAVTVYLKSKAYDESVFRISEGMDSRGFHYYEFRADFVKEMLA